MTNKLDLEREPRLASLAGRLRTAFRPPSAAELEQGLVALRARVAAERARPRILSRVAIGVSSVLFCFALGAGLVKLTQRGAPVAGTVSVARIQGGELLEGGYLSQVGPSGVELHFNEGSAIVLEPGTRGRLRSVTAEGPRFELARGTGSFKITPRVEHRWLVEAGPFVVTVTGTEFTVVWEPTAELFEVKLRRGRVTVSGPVVGPELALRPGQDLTVSLPKGETRIVEARAASARLPETPLSSAAPLPEELLAPLVPKAPSAPRPVASVASSQAGDPRGWRQALAAGEWDRILEDVEQRGVTSSLRTLSSEELFILADAARYRRRADLARAALLAQLERFPSAPRSVDALFLLGRVEEARPDGKARAIARYDEYLSRAPRGTYSAPALGRKLILTKEMHGTESARPLAEEYLERFPTGSYAEAARSIRQTP